jgi:uncharacterized protein with FMN-binding domain
MRRIVLWVLSTLSVLVLLFGYSTSTSGVLATKAPVSVYSSASGSTGSTSTGSTSTGASSAAGSVSPSAKSTSVTGSVAQTQWGPVQLQLAVSSGKITKVTVVQYPHGNGKDDEINSYALPILVQETMDSQSASIDMVSGATVTSDGYLQSLQSALDRAGL